MLKTYYHKWGGGTYISGYPNIKQLLGVLMVVGILGLYFSRGYFSCRDRVLKTEAKLGADRSAASFRTKCYLCSNYPQGTS